MKLEELTNKIYAEGVEKGNAEAKEIVAKAEEQAKAIIAEAQKQAQDCIAQAQQKAEELNKNTRSELRMFAEQSVNALKTEVTNLLTGTLVKDSVQAATADKAFMQSIITKLVQQMVEQGNVEIDTKDAASLKAYFEANAKGLIEKGVKIEEVKGLKTDFQIVPANGGYKLAFGEQEFVAYFREFLRPQLIEMLF